jgi:flagellar biosynthesis protein FlhG
MRDQAAKLRAMAQNVPYRTEESQVAGPKVIAVTSGKGGVGKTNLVVNLAVLLARMGKKVVIFDADLGLANVEVLLGITPAYTLYDVLYGDKDFNEILTAGPFDLKVVSGGTGLHELANLDYVQREKLVKALNHLQVDFVFVDTGAGINKNVLGFVAAAEEVIFIVTPEPTSLTDAYGLIKVLAKYKIYSEVGLVVNRTLSEREANQTAGRIEAVAGRFLQVKVKYLGFICEDRMVGLAVKNQQPFVLMSPNAAASKNLLSIAGCLLNEPCREAKGMSSFVGKLLRLFG